MQIYIGHMDKRLNSTKKTQTGDWTTKGPIDVTLKEPTTIDKPLFLLQRVVYDKNGTKLYELKPSDNWIFVPDWGYYWIDQTIMSTNDLVTFVCHRDVLASGHDYLKSCEAYLSYCSDKEIAVDYQTMDDPRFGPDKFVDQTIDSLKDPYHEGKEDSSYTLIQDWLVDGPLDGSVLVSITGVNAGSLLYFMTPEQYVQMVHYVASNANITDMNLLAAAFLGTDWKACLNYAIYVPISLDKLNEVYTNSMQTILWGNVAVYMAEDIHYTASPFQCLVHTSNRGISFTSLAENDDYAFLKGPKYSTVILETPSSSQDISSEAFTINDYLYIKETMNLINGDYTMKVYASNYSVQGVPLAAVTEHLGVDITGISKSVQGTQELAAGIIKSAAKVAVVAGGAMMAAGAAHESAIAAAKSHNAGIASQASKYGLPTETYAKAEGLSMAARPSAASFIGGAGAGYATGILGNFSGGNCGAAGAAYSCGGGLTSYFCCETNGTDCGRKSFRILTSTTAPALIADEVGTYEAMAKFAKLNGYPCNKWAALADVADSSYVECVQLSVISTSDDGYEPSMPEFTLTPAEIGELNNLANTGIYLEDWAEEEPEE